MANYEIIGYWVCLLGMKDRLQYIKERMGNSEADPASGHSFKSLGNLKEEGLHI